MRISNLLRAACVIPLLLLPVAVPAGAQTASLLRDINTSTGPFYRPPSLPRKLHAVRGKVLFEATEPANGRELWISDGSGEGTELLVDFCPGECSSGLEALGSLGGVLLWAAGFDREEIWRTDGTRAGTFSLNPGESGINLPSSNDVPYALTDRALIFYACRGDVGCELWTTDGTREARLVKDIVAGPSGLLLEQMIGAGSRVFFIARDGSFERFLGVTDGTQAGTVTVKKIDHGFRSFAAVGNRIFFLFSTLETGTELWTSDGTPQGTRALTKLPADQPFVSLDPFRGPVLIPAGGKVWFVADDSVHGPELWASDGTLAGTRRITDFDGDRPFPDLEGVPFLAETQGDRVVFVATDGVAPPKLWTSRGTPESLAPLPDPCQGNCSFLPSQDLQLFKVGKKVLFVANDGRHGQELWTTDGTPAGTRMLRDLCPGTCSSVEVPGARFFPQPGSLVFIGSPTPPPSVRAEIWRTDGTPEGTVRLSYDNFGASLEEAVLAGSNLFLARDELWVSENGAPPHLVTDIGRGEPSSFPRSFTAYHGLVYFIAYGEPFYEIWRTDGTREGTVQFTQDRPAATSLGDDLVVAGDHLFFLRLFGPPGDLWRTDGTAPGTILLLQGRIVRNLTPFQGRLYFLSSLDELSINELWSSDGTPQGTSRLLELPGSAGHLTAVGNALYFVTFHSVDLRQIWRFDGTTAEITKIAEVPERFEDPLFTQAGARVFFRAGGKLWATDGTAAGTAPIPAENSPWREVDEIAVLGGTLYFMAEMHNATRELWRSDGTDIGTSPIKSFPGVEQFSYEPRGLVSTGGRLFFFAHDGTHGTEPWVSDGTVAGTVLLRDIVPGSGSSLPRFPAVVEGRIFFPATDPAHGIELWQSDGTTAGTRMVQDIAPRALPSEPWEVKAAGGRLYFSAWDEASGREPWSLPLPDPGGCHPSSTRLCLNGGRFAVEVRWRDFQNNVGLGQAVALTADTGWFWFFDAANVEAVVKVLDGRGLNGHFWVFYGALSNVEYTLKVTDTQTGLSREYYNPPGRLASVGDTRGFGPLGAFSRTGPPAATSSPLISERTAAATGSCQPSATRLCLRDGRFAVEAAWKDFQGKTGKGTAVNLSGDTGYFWFFDAANVEVVLKVLDGTPLNGKHWVFYGALSNVEYTLTVTDTQTGKVKTYKNPSGRFASVADTAAF